MNICFSLLLAVLLVSPRSWAQDASSDRPSEDILENTQSDLLMVAGAGGAGAILGLSTLSFYDQPSKHISNIWVGAALGIIGGVIFVAVSNAQRAQEDIGMNTSPSDFTTAARSTWHSQHIGGLAPVNSGISSSLWTSRF